MSSRIKTSIEAIWLIFPAVFGKSRCLTFTKVTTISKPNTVIMNI